MDLNESAVFVRVVQAGSFSAAARQLGLPTSTVSSRVTRLERRLGVMLLQRTTRRLHLTDLGQLYFQHAEAGLACLLDAEAALTASVGEPQGSLRVTAPVGLGDYILAGLVGKMRETCPKVSLDLVLTSHYVDFVADGVDVAIRAGALKDSSLIAKSVGVARWRLYASPGYLAGAPALATPQALRNHRCVKFAPLGREAWALSGAAGSVTMSLPGQLLADDIRLVLALALAGEGVALLPVYLCRELCETGQLVPVLAGWEARAAPIHLVYPRQRFMAPKLRIFVDLAAEVLRDRLDAA